MACPLPHLRRLVVAALLAAAVAAQETTRVPVTVTSVAGTSIYFDKGRNDGLVPGVRIRLFAPGGQYELDVVTSSSSSARADLPAGIQAPPVGTQGEAEVRRGEGEKPTGTGTGPEKPQNPAHPPWSRQEGARDPNSPLLSPAYGQRPEDRPSLLRGRAYSMLAWNRDNGAGRDSDYFLGRLGTSLEYTNPFGAGGRGQFAGEIDRRELHIPSGADSTDDNGRIDLLSYAYGTEEFAPFRAEVGRFYSDALPELGLLDGVEGLAQFTSGWRLGGGLATYPLPFPARTNGEDYGIHLVADYRSPKQRTMALAFGLQETWHKGTQDRTLLLARAQVNPASMVWLYATAKVDYYTSKDDQKSSGFELTEGMLQARVDGSKVGGGLLGSTFRYPQLLRDEWVNLPANLLRDGHVDRIAADLWWRPHRMLRLYGRADTWKDQDSDGTSGEVGLGWYDFVGTGMTWDAAWFQSAGSFFSGPGVRTHLRGRAGELGYSVGYQWHRYSTDGMLAGSTELVRQSADVSLDWPIGRFDFNLTGERWFGDQEDAFAVTLFAQYRF